MMSRIRHAASGCFLVLALVLALILGQAQQSVASSIYDYTLPSIDGGELDLAAFEGQPLLLVNTASQCGFTPQYDGLQQLYEDYQDQGLVVLGVPSNDFGRQEKGTAKQIKEFCRVNFDISFPMTDKTIVKGAGAHPFYQWLGEELGMFAQPRWNFHKYLISRDGRAVNWFASTTRPQSPKLLAAVKDALKDQVVGTGKNS